LLDARILNLSFEGRSRFTNEFIIALIASKVFKNSSDGNLNFALLTQLIELIFNRLLLCLVILDLFGDSLEFVDQVHLRQVIIEFRLSVLKLGQLFMHLRQLRDEPTQQRQLHLVELALSKERLASSWLVTKNVVLLKFIDRLARIFQVICQLLVACHDICLKLSLVALFDLLFVCCVDSLVLLPLLESFAHRGDLNVDQRCLVLLKMKE